MKKIPLTQGKYALIDDDDFEDVSKFKWYVMRRGYGYYANRSKYIEGKRMNVQMHRFILNITDPKQDVDHINMNTLDNRRMNLRVCSRAENQRNRGAQKNNTTGFKGVTFNKKNKKYYARIRVDGELIPLGSSHDKREAAMFYNHGAIKYFAEFAVLNKI